MVSPFKVYLTDKQRKALCNRASRKSTSLSEEVRKAIDLYLAFPVVSKKEVLSLMAKDATASLNRSITRLNDAVNSGHFPPT